MWSLETRWFDVAVVLGIFAIGNICFGRFMEHVPRWRRVLKVVLVLGLVVGIAGWAGRGWAYGVLAVQAIGAAYVHLVWLPRRGVNGWTGEPRERYLEVVGALRR